MTKKETVTTNTQLNLERLTPGYFYIDVLHGNLDELKIPTVGEIAFVGIRNAHEFRQYICREENILRKLRTKDAEYRWCYARTLYKLSSVP